jgi:hypothetical protein
MLPYPPPCGRRPVDIGNDSIGKPNYLDNPGWRWWWHPVIRSRRICELADGRDAFRRRHPEPDRSLRHGQSSWGGQDDTANIQNAVNNCPLGQVVSLLPGIFTIAEGNYVLLNKGITLRGAGAGVTTLQRTNGARLGSDVPGSNPSPIIIAGPQRYNNNDTSTALTADAVQGTNSVQVASTQGFSVGQIVLLDEASGAGWQPDAIWSNMQIWAAPDYRVVWQKHNPYY